MVKLLLSLHSRISTSSALAIFDSKQGIEYLQMESPSDSVRQNQIRGIAVSEDTIYAVTPASLRIYKIEIGNKSLAPWFSLKKEVVLPEWISGDDNQADLLPIYMSEKKNRLFVGCNNLATIDEFDLDGAFKSRTHLSKISPQYCKFSKRNKFPFGHIRDISEAPSGELVFTVAFRTNKNKSARGAIISADSGEILLDRLHTPHGVAFNEEAVLYLNARNGSLLSNSYQNGTVGSSVWETKVEIEKPVRQINLRGIAVVGRSVFSSVFNLQQNERRWIKPGIVEFDSKSGVQINFVALPDLLEFRHPRVFGIKPLPGDLELPSDKDFTFIKYGELVREVEFFQSKVEELNDASESVEDAGVADLPVLGNSIITANDISLSYERGGSFVFGGRKNLRKMRKFWALENISFDVKEGEIVGLIGRNGSGKSTLGMLIVGALKPDIGILQTEGNTQLLSLGLGFRAELTGRDNIFIGATLLGLNKRKILDKITDIEAFAELGEFIDEPVRTYSAGMKSRLAFAIATAVEPDILVVDEVLSTGDQTFRTKAESRMREMRGNAKSVIIVSHNASQIRKLCSRVIWLERGHLMLDGDPKSVLAQYTRFCQSPEKWYNQHEEVKKPLVG